MAKKPAGTNEKLNAAVAEYERARKTAGTADRDNYEWDRTGGIDGAFTDGVFYQEEHLDKPELKNAISGRKTKRENVSPDSINRARVHRAHQKLKKAESEE